MRHHHCSLALLGLLGLAALSPVQAQIIVAPDKMNFQGRLTKPDGTPVANGAYSVRFSLWNAVSAGSETWNQTVASVAVKNGTFAVQLSGFPATAFNGNQWLEIKIGTNAPLTPRQQLVTVPYAMKANTVPDGSIGAAQVANGSLTANKFAANILNPLAWLLGGNSGTNPASQFLGTTDAQPLVFKVNNRRAMQYQYLELPNPNFGVATINVLGGTEDNEISPGVAGATIAGGGQESVFNGLNNRVTADFGTVGGGFGNTSDQNATVGGGNFNNASGLVSTVGGGYANLASGYRATVPGGSNNTAAGAYSFAAGFRAKANQDGTFVWGDSTDAEFTSTTANQFLIRASGGIGLGPSTFLDFGFGVAGREANAGKVGYALFTANTLDIVGAGTTNANRKIKFWAEGGTTFTGAINVNGTSYTSDRRYKTHIATFPDALDTILNLRGVTFDWDREQWKDRGFAAGKQIGFIAQEVEKILPELVSTDANGYRSVAYANVVPVLVEAVKALKQDNDRKEQRIGTLEKDNAVTKKEHAELKARQNAMESEMAELKAAVQRLTAQPR
jgi:hypothetical protein